jgi:hypothetical protein
MCRGSRTRLVELRGLFTSLVDEPGRQLRRVIPTLGWIAIGARHSRRSAFAGARRSESVPKQVGVSLTHEERVVAAFALGLHANLQCRSRDAPEVCDWRQPHYLVRLRGFAEQSEFAPRNLRSSVTQLMTARATCVACDIALSQLVAKFLASSRLARPHPPSGGSRATLRAHRCKLIAGCSPPLVPRPRALKGVSSPTRQAHPVPQVADPSLILQPGL